MAEKKRPIDLNGRKLMIAIPAYDGRVNIKTAIALAKLTPETNKFGVTLYISHISGCSLITKARNALVADFLETEDRKSTRLNSSHSQQSRMPSSA